LSKKIYRISIKNIYPDENNPRAYHVYEKAGFSPAANFKPLKGVFEGKATHLMVKHLQADEPL